MLKFLIVGSGSKGNATIVYDEKTTLLIDMGLPLCRLNDALGKIGKGISDLSCVLVTHEHSDHVCGLKYIDDVPVFSTRLTIEKPQKTLERLRPYSVGTFLVTPIPTSHDVVNPTGYRIDSLNGETLIYITDTGVLPAISLSFIKNATYYVFESNYDYKMLLSSDRPKILKDRIHSDHGHLSNVDSAIYMTGLIGPSTKEIVLAHLSEQCNSPEKALDTYRRIFDERGVGLGNIKLSCASQWDVFEGGQ